MIDFLFQDATVVDGSGSRPFVGDVAIRGDRIDRIGVVPPGEARVVIDACAMVLCPGFIDMHSHSDLVCANGRPVPHKVMQGVTTELIGQDGISAAPLTPASMPLMAEIIEPLSGKLQRPWTAWDMRGFLDALKHTGIQTNVMTLTGHCNLRIAAMGHRMAAASDEDLARMQAMLAESLEQGSCGLSLGLIYPPSSASNTRELIQLGHTVMQYDRIMIAHIRDEQDGLLEALDEMISVGSESGCRVHISHLKCMGKRNWGRMPQVLERLDRAAGRGIRISFDQYPYDASSTTLSMLLPAWAMEGGVDGFRNCTADADSRGKVLAHLRAAIERRGGPQSIRIASAPCADGTFLAGKDRAVRAWG
jgi:N-acyl-D-amino-acid deacylase